MDLFFTVVPIVITAIVATWNIRNSISKLEQRIAVVETKIETVILQLR